jgi:2-methylcitrate dehydratase PrpD
MDGLTVNSGANLTRTLAEWAVAVTYEALPDEVRELARQCVLDYLGVGLAGAADELARILLDEASEAGGAVQAAVIGHSARLPVGAAALVNGAMAHALDYDDVNLAMPGHCTVAILPALLALAEEKKASGKAVIAAFVAGYETCCRIGMALRPGHYTRGFHATGTVGAFGAAAACALQSRGRSAISHCSMVRPTRRRSTSLAAPGGSASCRTSPSRRGAQHTAGSTGCDASSPRMASPPPG